MRETNRLPHVDTMRLPILTTPSVSAKSVKSNTYNKRVEGTPADIATSQTYASALKKFQCVAEQNFISSLVAEVGTNACKFGVNERNQIVNYRSESIAVIFEFWYFLPSVCEQFNR